MSNLYVIAQQYEDGFLLLSMDEGVIAFDGQMAAEDYADDLDEPGEFITIPYDPSMGPMILTV